MILGCSDSRVPPELIFDCGLGDLFVVRTAGHGVDEAVLGSIHFGVTQLHIPLVVVLGHRRCGAVEAALAAGERGDVPGNAIGRLVESIRPAVAQVGDEAGDRLDAAVRAHVALTVKRLQADPVLAPSVAQGRLRVVGACYDLDSGWVELIAA
ncbi:MAG: carbonic anhydrase [Anaerolineae bacterium]|nr:carbonic anhydrase [Anaerolineae bacterium]